MSVNVDQIIREAYDELTLRSEQDRLRAEGIVYLSHKLAAAVQASNEEVAATEAAGEPSAVEQAKVFDAELVDEGSSSSYPRQDI